MTAHRMTAKERADRETMLAPYGNAGTNIRQPRTRIVDGREEQYNVTEPDAWRNAPPTTQYGPQWAACAIVAPCLTGAHGTGPNAADMAVEPTPEKTEEAPE
jgi:hypothetical protein